MKRVSEVRDIRNYLDYYGFWDGNQAMSGVKWASDVGRELALVGLLGLSRSYGSGWFERLVEAKVHWSEVGGKRRAYGTI